MVIVEKATHTKLLNPNSRLTTSSHFERQDLQITKYFKHGLSESLP